MSLKDWERDVTNRQRNIVFPDTNLNEGRFYRNIRVRQGGFQPGTESLSSGHRAFCDDHYLVRFGRNNRFDHWSA